MLRLMVICCSTYKTVYATYEFSLGRNTYIFELKTCFIIIYCWNKRFLVFVRTTQYYFVLGFGTITHCYLRKKWRVRTNKRVKINVDVEGFVKNGGRSRQATMEGRNKYNWGQEIHKVFVKIWDLWLFFLKVLTKLCLD